MNEQVDLTHAQVYQDYAGTPDAHPGLLEPMRRLAAGEVSGPIAVGAAAAINQMPEQNPFITDEDLRRRQDWESRIKRLSEASEEDYSHTAISIVEALCDEETVADFDVTELEAITYMGDWHERDIEQSKKLLTAINTYNKKFPNGKDLSGVVQHLVNDVKLKQLEILYLQKGADQKPSPLQEFLLRDTTGISEDDAYNHHRVATQIVTDFYQNKGGHLWVQPGQDKVVDSLVGFNDYFGSGVYDLPRVPKNIEDPEKLQAYETEMAQKINFLLSKRLGLPDKTIDAIWASQSSHWHWSSLADEPQAHFNKTKVEQSLFATAEAIKDFTSEQVQRLHTELGVVNFETYTSSELQTLLDLLDGKQETIDQLKAGDVTAIFTDAYGDHNGALKGVNAAYRKESGRTLQFEISQRKDFARAFELLKSRGVLPSTVVIAAHGTPGMTHFGLGQNRFAFKATKQVPGNPDMPGKEYHLDYDDAIKEIVEGYMRDSRSIDDPPTHIGRRRFILNSCSGDVNPGQNLPSTAHAITVLAGNKSTDVYGAQEVMYLAPDGGKSVRYLDEMGKNITTVSSLRSTPTGEPLVVRRRVDRIILTKEGV